MSVEIILHTKTATRDSLRKLLKELGYIPCKHLWQWPEGTLNYHWFDSTDYRSFDGVEATIYKPSSDDHNLGQCDWALHTRTRSSGSPTDKKYQNETIRIARARFGGNFYNDWLGKNRYTVTEPEQRDAASRGIYICYETVCQHIRAVRLAIPKPLDGMEKLIGTDLEDLARNDPMRVLYNALVPFAVASLENFFSQCFKILLRYDAQAQEKLKKQSRKVDFEDVIAIKNDTKNIEDVVADAYSFQNIASINRAFSDWFGIDIWKILRQKQKIGNRIAFLESRLNSIIQFRHGIVHRFDLDFDLTKKKIEEILDTALAVIDAFVDYLEKERGKSIRD